MRARNLNNELAQGISVSLGVLAIAIIMICTGLKGLEDTETSVHEAPLLRSVEHDGHLFLISMKGGILHHPDCDCFKMPLLFPDKE